MSEHQIKLIIRNIMLADKIYNLTIDNNYSFIDLLLYLSDTGDKSYKYSSFRIKHTFTLICINNLNEKLFSHENNGEIILLEIGYFSPKNSFQQLGNIISLYNYHLLNTTNIDDVCSINLGKIGEWIGFGRGPTTVPKEEDNTIHNLIFVRLNYDNPVAYNIHCLEKLIIWDDTVSLLIPHLNKRVKASKFIEIYENRSSIKILNLNGNDIQY